MGSLEILSIKDKPDGRLEITISISQENATMTGVISYPPFAELSHMPSVDRHFILAGTAIMEFLASTGLTKEEIDNAVATFINSARH